MQKSYFSHDIVKFLHFSPLGGQNPGRPQLARGERREQSEDRRERIDPVLYSMHESRKQFGEGTSGRCNGVVFVGV